MPTAAENTLYYRKTTRGLGLKSGLLILTAAIVNGFSTASEPEHPTPPCHDGENQTSFPVPTIMVDHLIQSYQSVVTDLVEYQSMSWLYSLGYRSITTIDDQKAACPKPITPFSVQPTYRKKKPRKYSSKTNATHDIIGGIVDDMLWDDEDDIEHYFERLLQLCSDNTTRLDKKKTKETPSQKNTTTNLSKCWELLYSLVHDARCTTRMDSRTTCRRDNAPASVTEPGDVWGALKSHHHDNNNNPETLNIVTVGAGPVGLLLANAFSNLDLKGLHGNTNNSTLSIRVTVFENRASAPGVKLPYSRGWGFAPDLKMLGAIADKRILQLFYALGSPTEAGEEATWANIFSIPINVLETLLLLSSRQRRDVVQFIYGEDVTQYLSELSEQIPNLLVLDASGHRLQTLERGNGCQESQNDANSAAAEVLGEEIGNAFPHNIATSQREPMYTIDGSPFRAPPLQDADEWCWFPAEYFPSLQEHEHVPKIVEQNNSLLYPIHPETKQPLASYWMHVHDLSATCTTDDALKKKLAHPTDVTTSTMCQLCQERSRLFDESIDESVASTKQWVRYQEEDDEMDESTKTANEEEVEGEEATADRLAQLVEFRGLLGPAKDQTRVDTICSAFCVPNSYYDGTDCYREEIQKQMKIPHDDSSGPWFTARLVNFNLSPKQAQAMMRILDNNGYATDPVGMPVSELPLEAMARDPEFQENNLLEVLETIATHAGPKHPTITIFLLRPYLYRDSLVEQSAIESLLTSKAAYAAESKASSSRSIFPMLRMGDSLLSGDVTLNSGLYTHVFMIGVWMCILKGELLRTCASTLG